MTLKKRLLPLATLTCLLLPIGTWAESSDASQYQAKGFLTEEANGIQELLANAAALGTMGLKSMQERGRMQEGMVADITIFDPEKVTDNATYEKGTLPSTGIPYVVVNGTIVVKDSKVLKGVNPGQPIRYASANSRFEPITIENWTHKFYASPVDFGGGLPGDQPRKVATPGAQPHIH